MYTLKLEDFEYEINGNNLIFKCLSEDKYDEIKILDKYVINDKDYTIKSFNSAPFINSKIKKIIFPESIKSIPYACFYSCTNLNSILLPDNIEKIEQRAFESSGIKEIKMSEKITEIPQGCFSDCKKLENINLNDNINKLNDGAFYQSGLINIKLSKNITEIPNYCFFGCNKLKNINLDNVKLIKKYSFEKCKNLNISYQNDKDIYIDNYDELVNKGFVDGQINQILKGYKKLIFLNNLPIDTPIDVFRTIINNFYKEPEQFSKIISEMEHIHINIDNKLKLYEIIENISKDRNTKNNDLFIIK